ncbi:Uncharacterised protein [Stenotrophomonas maltophilia]|nr:Uncharacterised protein [Stenotrophomonas maltophilia]
MRLEQPKQLLKHQFVAFAIGVIRLRHQLPPIASERRKCSQAVDDGGVSAFTKLADHFALGGKSVGRVGRIRCHVPGGREQHGADVRLTGLGYHAL